MTTAPNVRVIPAKPQTTENRDKYHQLRVAAYCRVSTEQEAQHNCYQVQIAYYTDLINRKKEWTLAGIFADEGISGTQAKKRPEFLKMIRLCKKQKIDIVITKSISRFARNTVDCLEYVRQLKDLGIGVIFEKENINTMTMTSEFMIALYGSFAQAESESISKNVSWGKQKAYAEGKVAFQYSKLLGYQKGADGKPEIVPDEAETVHLIYELFLDGLSFTRIKNALESRGKLTAMGNQIWSESNIKSILKNEKYVGDVLLQKTFTADCITKKVVKNNGERPMYLVTKHHAPIIDRDTFNRVQQELARRSSKRKISDKTKTEQGKYSGKYALSELLICGHCGTPYRRRVWSRNGKKKIVWRCSNRLTNGTKHCKKSETLEEGALNRAVMSAINRITCNDGDFVGAFRQNVIRVIGSYGLEQEPDEYDDKIKAKQEEMVALIAENAKEGSYTDEFDERYRKIAEEISTLKEEQIEARRKKKLADNYEQRLKEMVCFLEKQTCQIPEFDNYLVRRLIASIKVVSAEKLIIQFQSGIVMEQEISYD